MIFLSAGHYPERPGACFNDFCEHGEAVRWVNEIVSVIDVGVVIVPTGSLKKKTEYINNYDTGGESSICVEIHFNSALKDGHHIGTGAECLHMPESQKGAYVAHEIQGAIVADKEICDRGIKEGWYRMNRRNGPDYFLSKTRYPAVIIEPEFIQHMRVIQLKREDTCSRIAEKLIELNNEFNS